MTRSRTLMLLALALLTALTLGCGVLDSLKQKVTEEGGALVEQGKATIEAVATKAVDSQEKPAPQAEQATVAPTEPATDEEPTAEPPDEEGAVDLSQAVAFDALDSYRMTMTLTWRQEPKEGEVKEGAMTMLNEFDRASESRRTKIAGALPDGAGAGLGQAEEMEIIQIGKASYFGSDGEWVAAEMDEGLFGSETDWLSDPEDFASGKGTFVGEEQVNGVRAKHYHYAEGGIGSLGFGQVDESESDVWVANDHDIVVKVVTTWDGVDVAGTRWSGEMTVDVTDINQPVTISAPEGVEAPGMPADVPLMDGATDVVSMQGINGFTVAATPDEVIAFYGAEMPANGWTLSDDSMPTMRTYTKDARTATLMVEEDDDGSQVTLMIAEQ